MRAAAFAGRGAADHLGAVLDGLLGMEGAVLAGEALADDLRVLVDEDGHQAITFPHSSWPNLFRPSTPCRVELKEDVDARDKRGHDGETLRSNVITPPSQPSRSSARRRR